MNKKYISPELKNIHKIKINTNLPGDNYWIGIRRNNQYIPYKNSHSSPDISITNNEVEWTTIECKKKEKLIYYWIVDSHNLFDRRNKNCRLFFTDPDSTKIENMDLTNYMAIDESGNLKLLYCQLKHNGMKMNPTFYIAKTLKQIQDALKHVKYCVVKTENNEQKLIENPYLLQIFESK